MEEEKPRMKVYNKELLLAALHEFGPTTKFVMNSNAIVFFPHTQEHKDIKLANLSYEDNYKGNAVAGIIVSGKPEIRFHSEFPDIKILLLWKKLELEVPSIPFPTYQGRRIENLK